MGFCEGAAGALRNLEGVRRKQCAVYVEEQDFLSFIRSPLKWDFFFGVTVINVSNIINRKRFCGCIFNRVQCADTDAVEFYFTFHGDHKAFSTIDDAGFYQFCPVRCYMDHHVRGFDLEFPGVGDVGCYQS